MFKRHITLLHTLYTPSIFVSHSLNAYRFLEDPQSLSSQSGCKLAGGEGRGGGGGGGEDNNNNNDDDDANDNDDNDNNNDDDDDNDNNGRISGTPFHVKHVKQVQIQKYKTHAYKTLKTAGVQTIMLEHQTKQLQKIPTLNNTRILHNSLGLFGCFIVVVVVVVLTLIFVYLTDFHVCGLCGPSRRTALICLVNCLALLRER